MAETSQSSFGSTASPPLLLDETGAALGPSGKEIIGKPIDYRRFRRTYGPLLNTAHPFQASTSLPCSSVHFLDRMKPKFRKSSSQPSRSLSPPSLRFASPSIDENYYRGSNKPIPTTPTGSPFLIKKRRLPVVPFLRRSSHDRNLVSQEAPSYSPNLETTADYPLQPNISLTGRSSKYKNILHQRRSTDAITSGGIYSDSEIVNRPPYDRLFYAHPHRSSTHSNRGRNRRASEAQPSDDPYQGGGNNGNGDKVPVERRDSRTRHTSTRTEMDSNSGDSLAGTGVKHRKERGSIKVKPGNVASGDESESSSKTSLNSAFSNMSSRPRTSRTQG